MRLSGSLLTDSINFLVKIRKLNGGGSWVTEFVSRGACTSGKKEDKKLFTPGPLCTTATVKAALARDMGSRDMEFIQIVKNLREELVEIANLPKDKYTAVLMQGSGTFAVESVLQSVCDRKKKVMIIANGAYGERMGVICSRANVPFHLFSTTELHSIQVENPINKMESLGPENFSAVAVVHCETTTGIVNPMETLGARLKARYPHLIYIVDAMSSFGGMEADYSSADYIISSANKCLQGVPGFAFVIANIDKLKECKGYSMSLSLDLHEQWIGLEKNGQFRFTPPTHTILALQQACKELRDEGGVSGRAKRYAKNAEIIKKGMAERGFKQLVADKDAGHTITSFCYPSHPNFKFEKFYNLLSEMGQLIYPGKVTLSDCFRIGHIGDLHAADMEHLLCCIDKALQKMDIPCPIQ